ncbi:MAG: glutamate-1-semialdehyde 2,1-aminomutase, partial [Bradyrhizobium sp.]|nr:glutamate-1-semialdehyde 2,1-aminomutase [Bradyrhizobium sp.]
MNSRHKQLDAAAFERSLAMRSKAHSLIPGGAHTYAKGDDQYPVLAPSFLTRGEGCHVWDIDGNEFIEYGMGLRAVTLGHAYKPVVEAAHRQMLLGENYTRPATIELTCAEEFLGLIEGADMVKFAKNGSDATTAAVRLARAYTGRDLIARCGDQPFFSTDDWFIGNTPMSAGIPKVVQDLTLQFRYNDIESLRSLFAQHPGEIACVIMEAATAVEPQPGFLHAVQALCRKEGAVFILDEVITGFRWNVGGAQREYGITPDLSTFGKGIGNGFSVSALAGKRELMELGGLRD